MTSRSGASSMSHAHISYSTVLSDVHILANRNT